MGPVHRLTCSMAGNRCFNRKSGHPVSAAVSTGRPTDEGCCSLLAPRSCFSVPVLRSFSPSSDRLAVHPSSHGAGVALQCNVTGISHIVRVPAPQLASVVDCGIVESSISASSGSIRTGTGWYQSPIFTDRSSGNWKSLVVSPTRSDRRRPHSPLRTPDTVSPGTVTTVTLEPTA